MPTLEAPVVADQVTKAIEQGPSLDSARRGQRFWQALQDLPERPNRWDSTTIVALLALVALWAGLFHLTWASWGSVTIDSGREMYVPAALAKGRMLYRDVLYQYPPLAPYLNALLFRVFGIRLEVLYWAGSLAALGSAAFLFATGLRLSSRLAGWTAAAALLIEAFRRGLFSFPLPYSYASVYGCVAACLFIWLLARSAGSSRWIWKFSLATTAALATLLKLEFGAAFYAVLAIWIAADFVQERTRARVIRWLAALAPGATACAAVAAWMISIRGANFITHENMDSWPTSYFMQTYGKMWMKASGFDLSGHAIRTAAIQIFVLSCVVFALRWVLRRMEGNERRLVLWIALILALLVFIFGFPPPTIVRIFGVIFLPREVLSVIAFPPAMAVIVGGVALGAWWFFLRNGRIDGGAGARPVVALLLTFSALLPIRSLMQTETTGYPIYYNGPELLCFLILVSLVATPLASSARLRLCGTALICLACLAAVYGNSNIFDAFFKYYVPLTTDRGTILLPASTAENYKAAIAFIKEQSALGNSVMSIPEDTSLYFFSHTDPPTRVPGFVPGVVAPGEMTNEVIAQLERKPPEFLIWSNREYPEYGAPRFGTDFDRPIGDYLRAHYRPIGSLVPFDAAHWSAVIWERIGG